MTTSSLLSSSRPWSSFRIAGASLLTLASACFDPAPLDPVDSTDGSTGTSSGSDDSTNSDSGLDPDSSGAPPPVCGDGIVEGDEVCDDGVNNGSYEGCAAGCNALGPRCGDGIVNGGEACDDGDDLDGNGCNVDCIVSGTELWTVIYDGPDGGVDSGVGVAVDADDNIVVSANSISPTGSLGIVRKHSSSGSVLWTEGITGPTGDTTNSSVVTLENSIVIGGSFTTPRSSRDAWVRAFSLSGSPTWTQTHAGAGNGWDRTLALARDSDGFIYAVFIEDNAPTMSNSLSLVRKYSINGSEIWSQYFPGDMRALGLTVDGLDNLVISGESRLNTDNDWLLKLDSDGVEIWSRTIPSNGSTTQFLASSVSGQIAVGAAPPDADSRALLYSPNGDLVDEIFPPVHGHFVTIFSGHYDGSESLILGGSVLERADIWAWVSKINADGTLAWTNTFDGAFDNQYGWDRIESIDTDSHQNVIVTGSIHRSAGGSDLIVTKYTP